MTEEEDKEYEVDDIVGEKEVNGETYYIIRWKSGPDTLEPIENLVNCQEILFKYLEGKEKSEKEKKKSKNKPKVTVQKKNAKKGKSVKNSLAKTSKSYFSSDLDYFSDSSSDSSKSSSLKNKSKNEKAVKISPKKAKKKVSSKEDSDSGDIFSDFDLSQDEIEKEEEKETKKKEKSKKNDVEPKKTKKITTEKKSKSSSESKPKSQKKSTKKNDAKSDSKKRTLDRDISSENKYSLPFTIYAIDDEEESNKAVEKTKFNYSARYSEEHQLVSNPFPIKEMKNVVYENDVKQIECVIPDKIETEKFPVQILQILHPQMLDDFKSKNKNDF